MLTRQPITRICSLGVVDRVYFICSPGVVELVWSNLAQDFPLFHGENWQLCCALCHCWQIRNPNNTSGQQPSYLQSTMWRVCNLSFSNLLLLRGKNFPDTEAVWPVCVQITIIRGGPGPSPGHHNSRRRHCADTGQLRPQDRGLSTTSHILGVPHLVTWGFYRWCIYFLRIFSAGCVSLIILKLKYLNGFIPFHLDHQPFPQPTLFEFNEIKIEDFWLRLRSRENRNNGHFLVCVEW